MTRAVSELEQEIKALNAQDRVTLIQRLINDLDAPPDFGVEAAWQAEAEQRLAEIQSGQAKTYPMEDVVLEARSRLK